MKLFFLLIVATCVLSQKPQVTDPNANDVANSLLERLKAHAKAVDAQVAAAQTKSAAPTTDHVANGLLKAAQAQAKTNEAQAKKVLPPSAAPSSAPAASSAPSSAPASAAPAASSTATSTPAIGAANAATPAPPTARAIIIARAKQAITEADAEIVTKPESAERLNARKIRLAELVKCLGVLSNTKRICHLAYQESQKKWTAAHEAKAAGLHQELGKLSSKLDDCSTRDDEENCAAPVKAQMNKVTDAIVDHEANKEHNPLTKHTKMDTCEKLKERRAIFDKFEKDLEQIKALVAVEPVDQASVKKAKDALLQQVQALHDKIKKDVALCEVHTTESKQTHCSVEVQERLTAVRHRIKFVNELAGCARISVFADRQSCVTDALEKVHGTRPKLSGRCKRRACRKDFHEFNGVIMSATNSGASAMANQVTLAVAKARSQIDVETKQLYAKCLALLGERQSQCLRNADKRVATLKSRIEILERLEDCAAHVDLKRRARCNHHIEHLARASNNCPHGKETCKAEEAQKEEYEKFLDGLKNAVVVVSKATSTPQVINAALTTLSTPLKAAQAALEPKKVACVKITDDVPRRRCMRGVRREDRAVRLRLRNVNRLQRCVRHTDMMERARCANDLMSRAREETPEGCKHTAQACTVQNRKTRAYKKFVARLTRMSKSIDSAEEFNVRGERLNTKLDRITDDKSVECEEEDDPQKKLKCEQDLKALTEEVAEWRKSVTELERCKDHGDVDTRKECAKTLIKKATGAGPKMCHLNACKRQDAKRAAYDRFTNGLKEIESLLRVSSVSVHDVNTKAKALISKLRIHSLENVNHRKKNCRSKATSRARSSCRRGVRKLERAGRRSIDLVKRLQKCGTSTSQTHREDCADRVLKQAFELGPKRCRKTQCQLRNASRKHYLEFLGEVRKIAKVASGGSSTELDVKTSADHINGLLGADEQSLALKKSRCKKISSQNRRSKCMATTRKSMDHVLFKKKIMKRLLECAATEKKDLTRRRDCIDDVRESARRETPRACDADQRNKHRVQEVRHRRHHNSLRRHAKNFVGDLSELALYLTAPDFSQSTFNQRLERMRHDATESVVKYKLRAKRCRRIVDGSRRRDCGRKARAFIRLARDNVHRLDGLVTCTKSKDTVARELCIKNLLDEARDAVPRKALSPSECRHLADRVAEAEHFVEALKQGGSMRRTRANLKSAKADLRRKEDECRGMESHRRRRNCERELNAGKQRVANRELVLKRFEVCRQHVNKSKRTACEKDAIRRARKLVPESCPVPRRECDMLNRERDGYEAFLGRLRTIGIAVSVKKVNHQLVDAAVKDASSHNQKQVEMLTKKQSACDDSSRCVRRIRRQLEELKTRRSFIEKANACTRTADEKQRRHCVRQNLRRASRRVPKGCRDNQVRRFREARKRHREFIQSLKSLGRLLKAKSLNLKDLTAGFKEEADRIKPELLDLRFKIRRCSKRKQVACVRRARGARKALRSELRQLQDLKACINHTDLKKRVKCVDAKIRHAYRKMPRKARSKHECRKRKRERRAYRKFMRTLAQLTGAIDNEDGVQHHNVTAVTKILVQKFDEMDAQIGRESAKCDNLHRRERMKCYRRVDKWSRANKRQRGWVAHLDNVCAKLEDDDDKRHMCVAGVVKRSLEYMPRRCRRTTNCARRELKIKRFEKFGEQMTLIAANLTMVDDVLKKMQERKTRVSARRAKCDSLGRRSVRQECAKSVDRELVVLSRELVMVSLMKKCAALDDDEDAEVDSQTCAEQLAASIKAHPPRGCDKAKAVLTHPRAEIVRLRARLMKCTNAACKERLNKLLKIQLQALVRYRRAEKKRRVKEQLAKQDLHQQIADCGDDDSCSRPLMRRLARLFAREKRRRERKVEGLSQLSKLRKRMEMCQKSLQGQSCRRSVLEDYRLAVNVLIGSMDVHLRKEAVRSYKVNFATCSVNVDVDGCRGIATTKFVNRMTALATDAAEARLNMATRMCSLTDDADTCVSDAKTARDQDIAVASADAQGQASILAARWGGQASAAPSP